MSKLKISLFIIIFYWSKTYCQDIHAFCKIYLTNNVISNQVDFLLLNEKNEEISHYSLFISTLSDTNFTAFFNNVPITLKQARIEIHVDGYNDYSKNIADIKFIGKQCNIDLGKIILLQESKISVGKILIGYDTNFKNVFYISLTNNTKSEILITQLTIGASQDQHYNTCMEAHEELLYIINDNFQIINSNTGSINGKYKIDSQTYIRFTGELTTNTCYGGKYLHLLLPTYILLLPGPSQIKIVFPQKINIVDRTGKKTTDTILTFKEYNFQFSNEKAQLTFFGNTVNN